MKKALKELRKKINRVRKPKKIKDNVWENFVNNTTIVLMAGGESSRFSEVTNGSAVNKNAYLLPNGETMIEMAIKMYRDAGFKNFVASVFHNANSIENVLGDGSKLGVNIRYSYDPEKPVGKGGAIKHAINQNLIPKNHYFIVHNPDDVILDFKGSFPRYIAQGHLDQKKLATVVVVEETPYTYTGMKIINNVVHQIEMYPQIPIPTHIGITILAPEAHPYFEKHFDLNKKADFESVLFPILAKKKQLTAVSIPTDCWIAVNNAKAYKQLVKRLETK
jgi:NDP-sugar pyrophosphorylase family protein